MAVKPRDRSVIISAAEEAVLREHAGNRPSHEISALLDKPDWWATKAIRQLGLPGYRSGRDPARKAAVAEAKRLYCDEGLTARQVAAKVGCGINAETVMRWAFRHQWKRDPAIGRRNTQQSIMAWRRKPVPGSTEPLPEGVVAAWLEKNQPTQCPPRLACGLAPIEREFFADHPAKGSGWGGFSFGKAATATSPAPQSEAA